MAHYWRALILTQSNTLQNVEVETPGPWREDAVAQIKSMYAAKEVKNCTPLSKSSDDSSDHSTSSSSGGDSIVDAAAGMAGLVVVAALIIIWIFSWVILAGLIVGAVYLLVKYLKEKNQ